MPWKKGEGPKSTSPASWQRTVPPSRIRRRCVEGPGPSMTDAEACRVLWTELPTVSVGDQGRLELPVSLAELSEALRCIPTNKSPGMDGLTVEFYRVFWDVLGLDLVIVWAESLQSRVLPFLCR
ncbi:unnamed protein product [Caretta caretta]